MDPVTRRKIHKLAPDGRFLGPRACLSPDDRFVAMGHIYPGDATSCSIGVWTPKAPLASKLPKFYRLAFRFYRLSFRLDPQQIGWAGNRTLLVLTGGYDLGAEPVLYRGEGYREELYLADVVSLQSRPIPLPPEWRVHDMSPYPDCTKGVALLVSTESRVALVRLNPATGTFAEVAEMPGGNVRNARGFDEPRWFLLWSNPDRLYIWRYDQGQDKIVMTYRPSRGSVTPPRPVALAGYLCADASGRIWGFKDGKIASVPPVN
jgi:hypothetical protein